MQQSDFGINNQEVCRSVEEALGGCDLQCQSQDFFQGSSLPWSTGVALVERLLVLEVWWRLDWQDNPGGNDPG